MGQVTVADEINHQSCYTPVAISNGEYDITIWNSRNENRGKGGLPQLIYYTHCTKSAIKAGVSPPLSGEAYSNRSPVGVITELGRVL